MSWIEFEIQLQPSWFEGVSCEACVEEVVGRWSAILNHFVALRAEDPPKRYRGARLGRVAKKLQDALCALEDLGPHTAQILEVRADWHGTAHGLARLVDAANELADVPNDAGASGVSLRVWLLQELDEVFTRLRGVPARRYDAMRELFELVDEELTEDHLYKYRGDDRFHCEPRPDAAPFLELDFLIHAPTCENPLKTPL